MLAAEDTHVRCSPIHPAVSGRPSRIRRRGGEAARVREREGLHGSHAVVITHAGRRSWKDMKQWERGEGSRVGFVGRGGEGERQERRPLVTGLVWFDLMWLQEIRGEVTRPQQLAGGACRKATAGGELDDHRSFR
ncbi:hypothetical protein BHE74_00031971 [Ensete ventricosum]|nr:hypothetical protein BHE74_00031971 [Ensete ventricosum]RZS08265.1 hypothetical protein BHM03_00039215 [Ensete ventricosum]